MLEFYWAYADFNDLIELTETLFREVTQSVLGTTTIEVENGGSIDFSKPAVRQTMAESIITRTDLTEESLRDSQVMRDFLVNRNAKVEDAWGPGKLQMEIFEVLSLIHI